MVFMSTENIIPDQGEAGLKQVKDRLASLEQELAKSKRLAMISSLLALLLGGSGLLGLVQWMYTVPKLRKEIEVTQSQVEESKAKLVQAQLDFQIKIHDEEVRSSERELAKARLAGDRKTMIEVMRQISVNERGYRGILTQMSTIRISVTRQQ
jgi:hypothetical protein